MSLVKLTIQSILIVACRCFVVCICAAATNLCESLHLSHDTQHAFSVDADSCHSLDPKADAPVSVSKVCLCLTGTDLLFEPCIAIFLVKTMAPSIIAAA